jgi:CheY-like chemotaxis protein
VLGAVRHSRFSCRSAPAFGRRCTRAGYTTQSATTNANRSLAGIRFWSSTTESREVVAAHLREHEAVALTAPAARHSIFREERIDVLLADIAMPRRWLFAAASRPHAARRGRTIPAGALTALAHDDYRRRALEAGFQLHMAKPIEAASLIAAVSELYDRSPRVSLQH